MAAGGHHLLLHGAPGVGKTMLARRARGIFAPLDDEDAVAVTKVHAVGTRRVFDRLIRNVPLRMPHHSVSCAGLLGGGSPPRPGEVSLAHRGILFLDELPEYSRSCIEGLREPLESGEVAIVRANYAWNFPARFQLIAAMNPCPCGYFGHPERTCICSMATVSRYQQRISGPFLDRMDLVVPIVPIRRGDAKPAPGESSQAVRARVIVAQERQRERFAGERWRYNSQIPAHAASMEKYCPLSTNAALLLEETAQREVLSLRAQHRLRRVARTLADLHDGMLDAGGRLTDRCVAAALHLRKLPAI